MCDAFDLQDDDARSPPSPPQSVAARDLRIALCRSPAWDAAQPGTPEALEAAAEGLRRAGATVTPLDLPESFAPLGGMQQVVMRAEGQAAFLSLARLHPHRLHDDFRAQVENRDGISRAQLLAAYDHAARCRTEFDAIAAGYDAVLTPSAPGEAPPGTHPGDPVFNHLGAVHWTGKTDAAKVMAEMRATPINDFMTQGGTLRANGSVLRQRMLLQVKAPAESRYSWDRDDRRHLGDQARWPARLAELLPARRPRRLCAGLVRSEGLGYGAPAADAAGSIPFARMSAAASGPARRRSRARAASGRAALAPRPAEYVV